MTGSISDTTSNSSQLVFLMTNNFETGGSERQFVELARSLANTSFRPKVGCIAKRGPLTGAFPDAMEFPVGGNLYGIRSLRTRYQLARHLRQSRVAIAHAYDFYTNLLLIPAAKVACVPVVIGSQRQLGDLLSPAKARAQLAVFRLTDCVVCNSRAAADRLIAKGLPENRIVIIANGLGSHWFLPASPLLDRLPSLFRVGMIARMNATSKNHLLFLRAAAAISRKFPVMEFILAGDGPLRPELEFLARQLGIRKHVRFLGDRRDIPAVLASLDVSVLPSSSESLSNAILESMAAGVPVIATNVGANPELLANDRGILVHPDDAIALAKAIEQLFLNSRMRSELGSNSRTFVQSNFSMEATLKRHEELYSSLLQKKVQQRTSHRPSGMSMEVNGYRAARVAIIAPSSRYVGGQSVQAELLFDSWRGDPEVAASMIPMDPSLPRGLEWVQAVPLLRTIVRYPFYSATLWQKLDHADIAHIFSASYWSFLIASVPAWLVARLRGKKAVLHYHSGEARDHLRRFRSARFILPKFDRLVVPSQYLVDVFHEFGIRAQVVPNIVDLSHFAFRPRLRLRPHLICTRGFHPYYCIDQVVQAFAEVRREFPQARLDLLGMGPMQAEIRDLVAQLKLGGVNFCGVASRLEIARFYEQADIFINASVLDNMPVSFLEAFASGTPVVSTAPEGMRYLVEHGRTGLLSEPGDVPALAQHVIRLLRDPDFALGIASNAHEECRRYCWSVVRQQWLEIYRSLADRCYEPAEQTVDDRWLAGCSESRSPVVEKARLPTAAELPK